MTLGQRIGDAATTIQKLRPEEMVDQYRFADPAAIALARWLQRAGWRTLDLSDPAYLADCLIQSACERATENVCAAVTECDGDHCYPLEEPWRHRLSYFVAELVGLVDAPDCGVLTADCDPLLLAGIPAADLARGAAQPAIATAWAAVQEAIRGIYPNESTTHAIQRDRRHRLSA